MGSSAGAGSGEFHVYRHLRRKEYARQKFIQEKAHKVQLPFRYERFTRPFCRAALLFDVSKYSFLQELLDDEYHQKIEENKKRAEEVTAKKRAKRLKKKQKRNRNKRIKLTKQDNEAATNESEEDSSDDNNEAADEPRDEKNAQDSPKNVPTNDNETEAAKEPQSAQQRQEDTSETSEAPRWRCKGTNVRGWHVARYSDISIVKWDWKHLAKVENVMV